MYNLYIADPRIYSLIPYHDPLRTNCYRYRNWDEMIERHLDAKLAVIASPTQAHAAQVTALSQAGIPFYCEKPLVAAHHPVSFDPKLPCAVGHQYRFHPALTPERIAVIRENLNVSFYARDNLLQRYGPGVLGVMAAHPFDTACWLLGPALKVDMATDGVTAKGTITHDGGISRHDYSIDFPQRVSLIDCDTPSVTHRWMLDASNDMYIDALDAWLRWVEGGERDPRTATLEDGLRVVDIISKVEVVKHA
jgi:predicted dehydrogenase